MGVAGWHDFPGEKPGVYCMDDYVDSSTRLEGAENLAVTGIRFPDRPACSETL
jgi:hypothetical protein